MTKLKANVLIIGKSGVGKSSFLNYFLGKEVVKTGIGRPVTQNISSHLLHAKGFDIEIFDTKGLEAEKAMEIKKEIFMEIKKRNNSENISNWFHTIFYCISMKDARFQKFEVEFLKNLKSKISQEIHIILTNCDGIDKEKIVEMKNKIKEDIGEKIKIYEVCSVSKKLRNGTISKAFGKDKLLSELFYLLWENISLKMASILNYKIKTIIINLIYRLKNEIKFLIDIKLSLKKVIADELDDIFSTELDEKIELIFEGVKENTLKLLKSELKPAIDLYNYYVKALNYEEYDLDILVEYDMMDNISDKISTILESEIDATDILENQTSFGMLMSKIEEINEFSFDAAITYLKVGCSLIRIKTTAKEICDEFCDFVIKLIKELDLKNEIRESLKIKN